MANPERIINRSISFFTINQFKYSTELYFSKYPLSNDKLKATVPRQQKRTAPDCAAQGELLDYCVSGQSAAPPGTLDKNSSEISPEKL